MALSLNKGSIINTPKGNLELIKYLGSGKSGYSWLAKLDGMNVTFKQMHNNKCSYYTFQDNKTNLEVNAYKRLVGTGINIPELICFNTCDNYLVKEFVEGRTAAEAIGNNEITDSLIAQLFEISGTLVQRKINIDYFPTNFIITPDEKLVYIDYEVNEYMHEWSLENWGIYYWANTNGFRKFIETGNATHINENENSGIPIKEPFRKVVTRWIDRYADRK